MNNQSWRKRIQILVVVSLIFTLALGYRLFQKQILQHASYLAMAENQYIVKQDVPANRGKIYFSDMFPAATNTRLYQVVAVPKQLGDKNDIAKKLSTVLGVSEDEIFASINNDKYYALIKHRLTEEEGQKVADLKIKGITVLPESIRYYPEGQLASQVLGFVNASGDGKYGLEGYYNDELKGIGGEITL